MNSNEVLDDSRPPRAIRFYKWLLFAVEIFILWVFCNTLFLVPGPLFGARGAIILVTAPLAAVAAWGSGRMFGKGRSDESAKMGVILSSPPVVICIFVLAVATLVTAVAVLATR